MHKAFRQNGPELPGSRQQVGQLWLLAHSLGVSPGGAKPASPELPGLAFPAQGVPRITWPMAAPSAR